MTPAKNRKLVMDLRASLDAVATKAALDRGDITPIQARNIVQWIEQVAGQDDDGQPSAAVLHHLHQTLEANERVAIQVVRLVDEQRHRPLALLDQLLQLALAPLALLGKIWMCNWLSLVTISTPRLKCLAAEQQSAFLTKAG